VFFSSLSFSLSLFFFFFFFHGRSQSVGGESEGGPRSKGEQGGGGSIVAAAEREIKFAPQARFSSAISRYRKRGRQTNSQPCFFAQTGRV
jgi:hypothetical protein